MNQQHATVKGALSRARGAFAKLQMRLRLPRPWCRVSVFQQHACARALTMDVLNYSSGLRLAFLRARATRACTRTVAYDRCYLDRPHLDLGLALRGQIEVHITVLEVSGFLCEGALVSAAVLAIVSTP